MMDRALDPNKFPASPEHGKVVRATRSWGCANGREFWETRLMYEDKTFEYIDFESGDHYDA